MPVADEVFRAIAHPTRRQILGLLAGSSRSVKELTAAFEVSQPAISQHLKELRDARLVAAERVGLEQRYRLTASPIRAVHEWAEGYRRFFDPSGHVWAVVAAQGHAAAEEMPHKKKKKRKKGGRKDSH